MKSNFLLSVILFLSVNFLNAQTLYVPSGTSGIGSSTTSYVGIGISNPAYNLHVNDSSPTSNPGIKLSNGSGNFQIGISGCNGCYDANIGDVVLRPGSASYINNLIFHTNSTFNTGRFIVFKSLNSTLMKVGDNGVISIGSPVMSPAPSGGYNFGVQGNAVINGSLVLGDPSTITQTPQFPSGYSLYITGGILSEKVKISLKTTTDWSDFVFDSEYKLQPLDSVEAFIKENNHLPEIPSAEELVSEGIDVAKMDAKLLQKIEELTLYMIELEKKNKELEKRLQMVEKKKKK